MRTVTCGIVRLAVCAAWLALPSMAMAANILHLLNGKSVAFKTIRWDEAKKEYLLQPASGGEAIFPVSKNEVRRLEMDPPSEMVQAQQLLSARRDVEAIPLLQTVIAKCRGLDLDNIAREMLARIYVKGNQPAKAIQMVDELLAVGAGAAISPGLRVEYWNALLLTEPKSAKALKDFDEAIATGPLDVVPEALVRRANLRRSAGRKEDALQDYLRIILLFENVGAARTEALGKAAELYDELGDPTQAGELRKKLATAK